MKNKNLFTASLFLLYTMVGIGQTLLTSFENSDGYTLGQLSGQQTSDGLDWYAGEPSLFVITNEKATDGTYSLKGKLDKGGIVIGNNSWTGIATSTPALTAGGSKSISMDVYLPSTNEIDPNFITLFMPVNGTTFLAFMQMRNGLYFVQENGFQPQVGQFTYDTWHNHKIVFDEGNNMIHYYLDGQLLYSSPNGLSTTEIATMSLGLSDAGGFYVDNIVVNLNPNMSVYKTDNDLGFEYYIQNQYLFCKANRFIEQLKLYNLLGQEVCSVSNQKKQAHISLETLSKGVYIAEVDFEGGYNKTFKIVKR